MIIKALGIALIFFACGLHPICADAFLKNSQWKEAAHTPEDQERLAFFQSLYEKMDHKSPIGEIPKVFHVIWLGQNAFPPSSVTTMRTWLEKHPGWQVKLWTDRDVPSRFEGLQVMASELFPLKRCADVYYRAEDFEERSIILRYAILESEGGVYIDHDALCLASLEPLCASHDFFCGLEQPGSSIQSSSINPSWHLIAATPHHPILEYAQEWLIDHFRSFEALFPANDAASIANRMVHRSAHALSIAIETACGRDGRVDRVLPPEYFNASTRSLARYAFLAPKSLFGRRIQEAKTKEQMQDALKTLHSRLRICFYLVLALAVLNVVLGGVIVHLYRKKKSDKR